MSEEGIVDGWYHIDYHKPPKPVIEGRKKIMPWVDVYDVPTGDIVSAWWRCDGWTYESALPRCPNNKYWTYKKSTKALDLMYIKERCPYHRK